MAFVEKIGKALARVFGSANERAVNRLIPLVEEVASFEEKVSALSDLELRRMAAHFRARLARKECTLDDLIPEAFAVAREAGRRYLRTNEGGPMRAFDVQVMGAIVLHQGKIAEMVTGEGKTLVGTLASYLNAIPLVDDAEYEKFLEAYEKVKDDPEWNGFFDEQFRNTGVHIVTVNDYLARRDATEMGLVFEGAGLTAGFIQSHMPNEERSRAYACDITYGTNNEFGFDYLRDNMKVRIGDMVQRGHHFAIVDEVDSILIDEARTPLIISGMGEKVSDKFLKADRVTRRVITDGKGIEKHKFEESVKKHSTGFDREEAKARAEADYDYIWSEKDHSVVITERGLTKAQSLLNVDDFFTPETWDWPHFLTQSFRAHLLYKRDVNYVVQEGEVIIVDEFTGRLMHGRTWSDGLHQAVEAKERIPIKEETQTLATITFQNFFKLYEKISGMTGTALTEGPEFLKIYKLEVVAIPTNRPLIRAEYPDVIYRTEKEKYIAAVEELARLSETGRPVLVGTVSIEKSELLSELLKRRGVKHEVLNAKHHEREAMIVAKAGERGSITISTNMAGRGTDIRLGAGVAELGGLHILGTERHEARRIDNQLRGRAGRQGDPGSSQFLLSLEDDLMRIFAPDWVRNILGKVGMDEGTPITSRLVSRAIEKAQKKVEARNFDIRKHLFEYDEVMTKQREYVYRERLRVLRGEGLRELVEEYVTNAVDRACEKHIGPGIPDDERDLVALCRFLHNYYHIDVVPTQLEPLDFEPRIQFIMSKFRELYDRKEAPNPAKLRQTERLLLMDSIDDKWKDQLQAMDYLKEGIGLSGYAQLDPKNEYKKQGYQLFMEMREAIENEVATKILIADIPDEALAYLDEHYHVTSEVHEDAQNLAMREQAVEQSMAQGEALKPIERAIPKVGRNDPCPCGSGRKFKNCCEGLDEREIMNKMKRGGIDPAAMPSKKKKKKKKKKKRTEAG